LIKKTAILFFARTSEEEARAKSWTKSKPLNLRLANALHQQTSAVLAQSNLPVFIANQQKGQNFQERITNALYDFFEAGYHNAIVVGSDCADLSIDDIEKAKANFLVDKYTYGTSYDGGLYLFTLAKTDFVKKDLLALPWCTNQLSFALLENIYNSSSYSIEALDRKIDIDSDLNQIRYFLKLINRPFRQLILNLLSFCNTIVVEQKAITILFTSFLHNKGSPTAFSF